MAAENWSSKDLQRLLTEYLLQIQELSRLCNIYPEGGHKSKKDVKTATRRAAESLMSRSVDVSTIYSTIKSGINLIKETISEQEKHLPSVLACKAADTEIHLFPETVRQKLEPAWIRHNKDINTIFNQREVEYLFILKLLKDINSAMDICAQASGSEVSDCKTCAGLKDSDYWKLKTPSEIPTELDIKYSVSSAAGQYECSGTGLRWQCVSNVSLTCQIIDWESFREDFERNGYTPCGPLLDITVTSGTLEEVHLPHFLCLGDASFPDDAVKVLHVDDSGVSFENCQLTKFHAKLLKPTFSLKGVLIKTGFPVKAHCEILIYRTLSAHMKLHIYLFPRDPKMKEAVEKEEEKKKKSVKIDKPRPERSLQMKNWFRLRTLENLKRSECPSEITPEMLKLRYTTSTPNFFEVYSENTKNHFILELITEENEVLWGVTIREDDFSQMSSMAHLSLYSKEIKTPRDLMLEYLQDLEEAEINSFKSHLNQKWKNSKPIPRGKMEKATSDKLVDIMIEHYGSSDAGLAMICILRKMNKNQHALNLEQQLQ